MQIFIRFLSESVCFYLLIYNSFTPKKQITTSFLRQYFSILCFTWAVILLKHDQGYSWEAKCSSAFLLSDTLWHIISHNQNCHVFPAPGIQTCISIKLILHSPNNVLINTFYLLTAAISLQQRQTKWIDH